jgi:hypothetical protein
LSLIDKIEVDDLELYCIDASTGEKMVYPSQDYALFSVQNRILIAFYNYRTLTPKTYIYAEYENVKQIIQVSIYEDVQKFFHMGKDHTWGSFVFTGSRIVQKSDIVITNKRCDIDDYGPIYWDNTGNISTNPQNSSFSQTMSIADIADFSIIASVPNAGHILYLRFKPVNGRIMADEVNNEAVVPASSRTLFEIIKLIDEWSTVSEEPWNNTQAISTKAKEFINKLNIPQEIMNSVRSLQTDMQVYRYLAGDENARSRPPLEEIALMPDVVYSWFKEQFCYRSFESLVLYHPAFN